jgi:integrase
MATFLPACHGHRVKAVVRRRGYRPITRTFDTRADAELWAGQVEREMAQGVFADLGPAVRRPLRRVIELYSRQYTGKKRGWRQEMNRVKAWLRDPLTELPIAKIRSRNISAWIKEQEARGLAPSTIKNALQIISQAYRYAATELGFDGLVNPARGVRMPAAREGRDRRLEPGRQRAVALSPAAKRALEEVRGLDPDDVFPEFAARGGDRLLERQWYKVLTGASIERLHFHDLRHEGISRLFEKGLILPEVMQMSGHTTPAMLMRYTHLHVDPIAAKLAA